MKTIKIFILLAVQLCTTAAGAQTNVGTDTNLRDAIQNGANITVPADIDLSDFPDLKEKRLQVSGETLSLQMETRQKQR